MDLFIEAVSWVRGLLIASVLLITAGCQQSGSAIGNEASTGVVSVDYCADQFVLELVSAHDIRALSPDAVKHFSYLKDKAAGLNTVRANTEDVLALNPAVVVRSYGGGPGFTEAMEKAGVRVVQLAFPQTLDAINENILNVAAQLDAKRAGQSLSDQFMQRRSALKQRTAPGRTVLYTTPGGVTSGPGSLIHEIIVAAGLQNYETRAGWHELPLEQLVIHRPDVVAAASFGQSSDEVDPWTVARHPLFKEIIGDVPAVAVDGSWTSCGAWFVMDAIEALATHAARTH